MTKHEKEKYEGPEEEGSIWRNIGKILFLIAVLTAAWFILDRLIGK